MKPPPKSAPLDPAVRAKITSRIETITPETAEQYLCQNSHNRPLNNKHVAKLADQMKRGLWKLNGDSIGWDVEGKLVDGQHRLWGCVEAGVAFETLVVRGLPLDAFETKGLLQRLRSHGDVLAIAGETQSWKLAASLQWLQRMREDEMTTGKVWSARELMAVLEIHPHLRDFVRLVPGGKWLPHSLFVALTYCFGQVDGDLCERFYTGLKNGFELGTPFHLLRERLLANATNHLKVDNVYVAALAIRAFNYERAGKPCKTLRWQKDLEKFPRIEGLKLK